VLVVVQISAFGLKGGCVQIHFQALRLIQRSKHITTPKVALDPFQIFSSSGSSSMVQPLTSDREVDGDGANQERMITLGANAIAAIRTSRFGNRKSSILVVGDRLSAGVSLL